MTARATKNVDREGPVHRQILQGLRLVLPGALIHHSPNEFGMNGPEIARTLMVSLNTMRTHTKNIFSKLGVNNRRAAVHRAEELDLL